MSVMPPNNSNPLIHIQPQASAQGVNVGTQAAKKVVVPEGHNIVQAIDAELALAGVGPNDTVECNGICKRENANDLNSPRTIGTYYNEDLKQHCYSVGIVWEIKITKEDGTTQNINVQQERFSTLTVPPVNKFRLETDYGYKAFLLGNEYAKTISSVFDTNHPDYAQMQGATKTQLLDNDTLYIEVRPNWFYRLAFGFGEVSDDPSIIFKGYGSSKVEWAGPNGKKVKIIDRNFRKEVYEVDHVSQKILRKTNNKPSADKYITDGLDILLTERIKLDVKHGWFKKLAELEKINKDEIVHELQNNGIPESDWVDRISQQGVKAFQKRMGMFGNGAYEESQFPEFVHQIHELRQEPDKNKDTLKQLQAEYDKLPDSIAELRNYADQLELLISRNPGIRIGRNSNGWDVKKMRERADYMEHLHNALEPELGTNSKMKMKPL